MRIISSFLFGSAIAVVHAGCTSPEFIASSPDAAADIDSASGSTLSGSSSSGSGGSGTSDSGASVADSGSGGTEAGAADSGSSSSSEGGTTPDSGGSSSCVTNADCSDHGLCGYETSAACMATGRCFPTTGAICNLFEPGCACDGSEISIACTGLPTGYVSKPLAHAGACMDASTLHDAATPPDSGEPCTSTTDCPAGDECGFPIPAPASTKTDVCPAAGTAMGTCFPLQPITCLAYSPGCACDHTEINVACNGLPSDYTTKPLAHTGACVDGG